MAANLGTAHGAVNRAMMRVAAIPVVPQCGHGPGEQESRTNAGRERIVGIHFQALQAWPQPCDRREELPECGTILLGPNFGEIS
jgi:hypothetical protein